MSTLKFSSWQDLNGDTIYDAGTLGAIGTWTDYTPALTASTDPTLGTGSITYGRYVQLNDLVIGTAYFVFGSGASAGSGNYNVSLPVAAVTGDVNVIAGHCWVYDSSVSTARHAILQTTTSTTGLMLLSDNASFVVASTVPFTFTTNDQIRVHFRYEAA
jgi:hypothetical protein